MKCDRISQKKFIQGITLIELLLVVSLMAGISLTLYNAFSAGLKIWHRHQKLVVEENIAIFFDKLSHDLRNVYYYSLIAAEGSYDHFSFPAIILTVKDDRLQKEEVDYVEQLGKVKYSFRLLDKTIYRQKAGYSDALNKSFGPGEPIAKGIDRLTFKYVYRGEEGETLSDTVLETLPSSIEVKVTFTSNEQQKSLRKFIDLPLNT